MLIPTWRIFLYNKISFSGIGCANADSVSIKNETMVARRTILVFKGNTLISSTNSNLS